MNNNKFTARDQYKEIMRMSMHMLMRPNLYIYLDAPVDHVSYIGKLFKNESTANLKSNLFHHIFTESYYQFFIHTNLTGNQKHSEPWK